ncbi:MAG: TonB-dependent receptor [Steroidobacteraceae bacterium]
MGSSWFFAPNNCARVVCVTLAVSAAIAKAADEPGGSLEEVIVTAERVEVSAQKTAISMEVLDADALRNQGVTSIQSLSAVSPSVNITGAGNGTVLTMRGISSRDTTEIGDPAVVVSHDGFYQDRAYALGLTQYDLARVEILRGPQGTLYGRNATGGAINIYNARPGKDTNGYIQVGAGNYSNIDTEGAANVALSDRLQMRFSFGTRYHDGYRGTSRQWGKLDDENARSGRFQLAWQPTDNLSLRATIEHTVQTALGSPGNPAPYVTDANGWVVHSMPTLQDAKTFTKYVQTRLNLTDTMLRYDATYTAPWATITYLGGFDDLKDDSLTGGPNYIYGPATTANPAPAYQARDYNQTENPKTTNQELRFASPNQDSRFTWQAGVYYFRNKNHLDSFNFAPNGTLAPTPVIHFIYDVEIKSLAEMAQVSFKLLDNLKLTAGMRHNDDDKNRIGYLFFAETLPPGALPGAPLSVSVKKNTYNFGVDWQVTPDSLIYAKYGTGYKSGGFTDVAPYGPESVKTAEIGTKNRFLQNRLQVNFDVYSSDYTGQQVQQIVPYGGGLTIVNAGSTKYRGAELDFTALTPIAKVDLNIAYMDSEFKDFLVPATTPRWTGTSWQNRSVCMPGTTTAPAGCDLGPVDLGPNAVLVATPSPTNPNATSVQLAGNAPQQAPKWSVGGAIEHTWEGAAGRLTGRVSAKYQSKQFFTFFNRTDDTQAAYTLTNLSLMYQPASGAWQMQAYVNNLSDETVFSSAGPNDRSYVYSYSYLAPRTFGVRYMYQWQ